MKVKNVWFGFILKEKKLVCSRAHTLTVYGGLEMEYSKSCHTQNQVLVGWLVLWFFVWFVGFVVVFFFSFYAIIETRM